MFLSTNIISENKRLSVIIHRLYIVYSRRFKLPMHYPAEVRFRSCPVRHTGATALRRISNCHDQLVSCLVLCHPVQVNCYYPHICPFQKGNDKITAFFNVFIRHCCFSTEQWSFFQFIKDSCIGFKTNLPYIHRLMRK